MAYPDQARRREEALVKATMAVKEAKRTDSVLMARVEAERILRMYPECPVSLEELQEEMYRLAVADRLAVEFG